MSQTVRVECGGGEVNRSLTINHRNLPKYHQFESIIADDSNKY